MISSLARTLATFGLALAAVAPLRAQTPAQLFPGSQSSAGLGARGFASGDLNGDGKVDVVTANFVAGGIQVLLGDGTGGFGPAAFFAMNPGARTVALADLNGDGLLDVGTANTAANTFTRRLGNGAGGFGAPLTLPMGNAPTGIGFADLDGDADLDVVTANFGSVDLTVRLNNGAGMFGAMNAFPIATAPGALALADVNGDGNVDALTANPVAGEVNVRFGNGAGLLVAPAVFGTGAGPRDLVIVDLDVDGNLDVVTANDGGGNDFSWLQGNGAGMFAAAVAINAGTLVRSVVVEDLDGDGDLDIAGASSPTGSAVVLLGNGAGAFPITARIPAGSSPFLLRSLDLDNDGLLDLVATDEAPTGQVTAMRNTGAGWPKSASMLGAPVGVAAAALGDLDADGNPDLVSLGSTNGAFQVRLGDGAGGFGPQTTFPMGNGSASLLVLDFDRDGDLDVATADEGSMQVSFRQGDGAGGFGAQLPVALTVAFPHAMAAGDLDGDGYVDVVVAHQDALEQVTTLENDTAGSSTFLPSVVWMFAGDVRDLAVTDVLKDGSMDIVLLDATSGDLSYFSSPGLGPIFVPPTVLAGGTSPVALAADDVDHDGDVDFVTAGASSLNVLLGDGAGAWVAAPSVALPSQPSHLLVSDVTGDGNADAIVALPAVGGLAVVAGDGLGGFSGMRRFAAGAGAQFVALSDVDHDARPDLFVASPSPIDEVAVLRNRTETPFSIQSYGMGTPGCAGQIGLNANAEPSIGDAAFGVNVANAPPSALGVLLIADTQDAAGTDYFGIGLDFHVNLATAATLLTTNASSDANGVGFVGLPIPNAPILVGIALDLQTLWVELPSKGLGCSTALLNLVSSRGLKVIFVP